MRTTCNCSGLLLLSTLIAASVSPAQSPLEPLRRCVVRDDAKCAAMEMSRLKEPKLRGSLEYLELAAHALLLQGRHSDALQAVQQALEQKPGEYNYLMVQGKIYQKMDDQASAIQSFLLAQKQAPQSADVYYSIAMSFFLEEEYPRAFRHFRHVVEIAPSDHKALFMLGVLHAYQGQLTDARTCLEKSLALQPRNAHYRLHYGVLLNREGDAERALNEIKHAVELDSYNPLAQYHLGRLYRVREELGPARKHLEQAVKLQPSLSQAYYQLSGVYRKLGMKEAAQQALLKFKETQSAEQEKAATGPDALVLDLPGTPAQPAPR